MNTLATIPKDALFLIALEFSLPDLLNFCSSSKRINSQICQRDEIWYHKLEKDFPDWDNQDNQENLKSLNIELSSKTVRDIYILLYNLTILKKKLNIKNIFYLKQEHIVSDFYPII